MILTLCGLVFIETSNFYMLHAALTTIPTHSKYLWVIFTRQWTNPNLWIGDLKIISKCPDTTMRFLLVGQDVLRLHELSTTQRHCFVGIQVRNISTAYWRRPSPYINLFWCTKNPLEEKNITIVMETILKRSNLFQPLLLRCCIRFIWGEFISLIAPSCFCCGVGVQECGTRKDEHRKDNYPKTRLIWYVYIWWWSYLLKL